MEIVDLSEEHENLYFLCLEDWSEEMKEAGDHKERWYGEMKEKGLHVKLALDDQGEVGGMIQYLPIEHSIVSGSDLYFIPCIWVHGYKEGRGNFQKSGMGSALLRAVEEDVREMGSKGLVAWGIALPFWMKASWFVKQGYNKVDRMGLQVLLWKPFSIDAIQPAWIPRKQNPVTTDGKVTVTAFINGCCPAQNLVFERAKRAAGDFGNEVIFRGIHTSDREVFLKWGISDALFINGKLIRSGPPPSYEKIHKLIEKQVKKLK